MSAVALVGGYERGLIAEAIALHMAYYGPAWNFGIAFEAKLAGDMGAFYARYDKASDLVLAARDRDGTLIGTLVLDAADIAGEGVHLRWFVVDVASHGCGIGGRLLTRAVEHLDALGDARCFLTTFAGLDAARSLYERHGFGLIREERRDPWSGTVGLQRFERRPPA